VKFQTIGLSLINRKEVLEAVANREGLELLGIESCKRLVVLINFMGKRSGEMCLRLGEGDWED